MRVHLCSCCLAVLFPGGLRVVVKCHQGYCTQAPTGAVGVPKPSRVQRQGKVSKGFWFIVVTVIFEPEENTAKFCISSERPQITSLSRWKNITSVYLELAMTNCRWSCCLVTKSCTTLCDPMDYSPLGSSVHDISQARIWEWVAISFSRASS